MAHPLNIAVPPDRLFRPQRGCAGSHTPEPGQPESGKTLRQKSGVLEITDTTKIHAITFTSHAKFLGHFSLFTGSPVFPGDTPYSQQWCATIGPGCPVNVSAITLSPHVGAHADAPLHYDEGGASIGPWRWMRFWARAVSSTPSAAGR